MKKFLTLHKFFIASALLIAAIVIGVSAHKDRQQTAIQNRAPVLTSTASVQILSVNDDDIHPSSVTIKGIPYLSRQIVVHLKNNSAKTIKAYEICAGGSCVGDWELYDDRVVPGGAEFVASPNYQTKASDPQKFTGQILVKAVIFDDGTWEGDKNQVDDIRGQSDGARSFYSEAAPILAKAVAAGGTPQSLDAAELEIKSIPVTAPATESPSAYDLAVSLRRSVAKDFLLDYFTHTRERLSSGKINDVQLKASLKHTARLLSSAIQRQ
jgi:hypothetical protein